MIIYFTFIVFYSFNKEIDFFRSSRVPYDLIFYFLVLEILELVYSVISSNILVYLFSFKNWFEMTGFILCYVTFKLNENNAFKSSLVSINILLCYFILIFRLNKCVCVGAYVNIFGTVMKKSFRFFIIVLNVLFGFLFSFRNRNNQSNSSSSSSSDQSEGISHFNRTLSNSVFTII